MKDYSKYSDFELTTLLREEGDSSDNAFNMIYSKYASQTYGYCIYRSSSIEDAQELMQDTWMKFYRTVKSGKTTENILPLLLKIAKTLSIDRHRHQIAKKNLNTEYLSDETIDRIADPFDFQSNIEKEELNKLVKIAVSNLDEIYKDSLTLYWFGGLSFKEIAEICNETEQCIRTRMERAFKQLARLLKPYLVETYKSGKN